MELNENLTRNPERSARNLLAKFWDLKIPVNPVILAEKLGLAVYEDTESVGPIKALYDKEDLSITIISKQSLPEKRYAIASGICKHIIPGATKNETTRFIGALLIPTEPFEFLMKTKTYQELLESFGVPEFLIVYRFNQYWRFG